MTTKIDVSKLKKRPVPAGHKIKYRHIYKTTDGRDLYQNEQGRWVVPETGETYTGVRRLCGTTAWLETANGFMAATGLAMCNPKDTPIKKLGVVIAHNRCVKAFETIEHALSV